MAEEKESPFIEEGTTETESEQQAPDTDGLLAELKNAGVSNTEELQNKLKASAEIGNMAYKLGEERRTNAELLKRMEALETKPVAEDVSTDYGQPVDLQGEIGKGVNKALDARDQKAAQAQQAQMMAWNTIQNDEDFHLIQPIWEEKLKDQNFVFGIQSGKINPIAEYQNTLRNYYKGMMQKSAETIEKMQGGKVKTPIVEQGSSVSSGIEEDVDGESKVMLSLKTKIDSGGNLSEAEELAALQASFSK
jgi:hypothetical protein